MRPLDNPRSFGCLDRSDMLGKISRFPKQVRHGWDLGRSWQVPGKWKHLRGLIVVGMGGSAIGGDLLQGLFGENLSRPVQVCRGYTLPAWVNRETLILAVSYSGNTEETLSACREALRRRLPLCAITSGGRLARWSQEKKVPLCAIPAGWPPRAALGYTTFVPAGLLGRLGWLAEKKIHLPQALDALELFVEGKLSPSVPESSNPAKRIARRLAGRLPIIYGAAGGWEGIVYRWRTQLEENAKSLAFHHIFPEMTHNEISGWGAPPGLTKNLTAIFLDDAAHHPRLRRRMEFVRRIVQKEGVQTLTVSLSGSSPLERKLRLIVLGDFVSVYLGILYRLDPSPVVRVEALKKWLR